ncbi:SusE domain-containing protein [Flavobacterium sp.]|uniref:SusE domain-containing protein n=1 Tax=Flavobacterium sp. TaxID=239 RepID=UPI0025E4E1DF|nr:SusE domain-containing protein [Flavobacterium sp.]
MKNKFKIVLALIAFVGITSCQKEDNFKLSQPVGTYKITTPLNGDSIILNEATPTNPGASLTWTPMDYTTPSVITYTVQLAPNGSDFSNAQDLLTTTNTNATVQSSQLNLAALMAGATPFVQSPVDIRIKATSGTTGTQPVYSDTITYLITCYGCLGQYAVGAGIPSAGWNWNSPLSLICDNNVLTSRANLINDTFRFFTVNGDYSSGRNYPYYVAQGYLISTSLVNAADGDQNFRFTGTPGTYRIKIDGNKKTVTVAKSTVTSGFEPTSTWLVGAATPGGWSWSGNNETELPLITDGIYEVPLTLNNDQAFRVFLGNNGGDSWGLGDRNYPWYVANGYTIDSELINAMDGDSNFKYTGPTAARIFRINTITKVISVD